MVGLKILIREGRFKGHPFGVISKKALPIFGEEAYMVESTHGKQGRFAVSDIAEHFIVVDDDMREITL